MPHLHFMMDAYDVFEEQNNNIMAVYELLNTVAFNLNLEPIMPPFLVPYYYCEDAEDGGVSAFILCRGGHVTIHTFPYRSCYFVDILSDNFFTQRQAETEFLHQLHAKKTQCDLIDRRAIYDSAYQEQIDANIDFGPHYMIEVKNVSMTMESIYTWLDTVAPKINMLPITRPYVLTDKIENPDFISGILVVAQSHIAVHYNIKEKIALIDIFSCAFLEDEAIRNILRTTFGENVKWKLFSRGSKHDYQYKRKETRIGVCKSWRDNL